MHDVKIIEKKRLSDGQIAVLIQCCGDSQHQSWHTLEVNLSTTPESITAWAEDRKQHVQTQHALTQAADAHLESLMK
jgi:hypothetical protein